MSLFWISPRYNSFKVWELYLLVLYAVRHELALRILRASVINPQSGEVEIPPLILDSSIAKYSTSHWNYIVTLQQHKAF